MIVGRTRNVVFFAADAGAGGAGAGGAGAGAGGAGAGAGGAGAGAAGAGAGAGGAGAGAGAGAGGAGAGGAGAGGAGAGAGGAAGAAVGFADTLPEDIRTDAAFKDIKDFEGLARGFHGQVKLLGVPKDQLIRLPAADADEAALGEVYTKLGRPESAEKYVIKPPEGVQFTDTDKAFHAAILPAIHKAGLNQRQLDIVSAAFNEFGTKQQGAHTTAQAAGVEATVTALKTEWGGAYEGRLARAGDALEHLAKEAKVDLGAVKGELDRSGLATRPALTKLLDHIGAGFEEDGTLKGRGGAGGGGTMTPTEAKQQINALMADPVFKKSWLNKDDPGHKDAVAKRAKFYEIAYPGGA